MNDAYNIDATVENQTAKSDLASRDRLVAVATVTWLVGIICLVVGVVVV